MPPASSNQSVAGATTNYILAPSPFGHLMLAATERGLCSVQLADTDAELKAELAVVYPEAVELPPAAPESLRFNPWIEAIQHYLDGGCEALALPTDVSATPFQRRVWDLLRAIPYGGTRTYSQLAGDLGQPGAVRAVGSACAHNPLALVIPCHRVLRSDGALGGFRWGLERKRGLLALEARARRAENPGLFDSCLPKGQ